MKILFITLGSQRLASSRTRVFQYIPYLEQEGITSYVIILKPHLPDDPKGVIFRNYCNIRKVISISRFFFLSFFYKVIFIQKIYLPKYMLSLFRMLKKVVIYDFDDAIYTTYENKEISPKKLSRLNHTLKNVSLVVVENDVNKKYSEQYNNNIIIITGPIECNRYSPAINKKNEKITIGWIGSPSSTNYVHIIEDALVKIKTKYQDKVNLLFIGASGLNLKTEFINVPWNLTTEVELLQKFDIGIMPLPDDIWSRGKGGYKLLQYMAIGIPSVATPVGINSELIIHNENGFIANSNEEWFNCLENLIIDEQLRIKMGNASRKKAVEFFSFEKNCKELIQQINNCQEQLN